MGRGDDHCFPDPSFHGVSSLTGILRQRVKASPDFLQKDRDWRIRKAAHKIPDLLGVFEPVTTPRPWVWVLKCERPVCKIIPVFAK